MRISRILFGMGIVVLVLLALFAIPKFNFSIGDRQLTWPGLELKDLGLNTKLGTFNQGKDLYPGFGLKITPQLSADPQADNNKLLNSDLAIVRQRMDFAGLYDVDLFSQSINGSPELSLHFPQYYGQTVAESLANLLVAPGQISFVEHDSSGDPKASPTTFSGAMIAQLIQGYIEKPSELAASDIQSMGIESRVNLGGVVIRMKVNDDASAKLRIALDRVKNETNSTKPIIMIVDQQPRFALVDLSLNNEVLAAPINDIYLPEQLNVVTAYPPIYLSLLLAYDDPITNEIPATYAPEGHAFLAWMFVAIGAFTLIWLMRTYAQPKLIIYSLNLAAFVLVSVDVLKIATVAISTGMLIGFLIMYLIAVVSLHTLLTNSEADFKTSRLQQRDIAAFIFLVSALLYMSNIIYGEFQNLLGVVALMSAVLAIIFTFSVRIFNQAAIAGLKFRRN